MKFFEIHECLWNSWNSLNKNIVSTSIVDFDEIHASLRNSTMFTTFKAATASQPVCVQVHLVQMHESCLVYTGGCVHTSMHLHNRPDHLASEVSPNDTPDLSIQTSNQDGSSTTNPLFHSFVSPKAWNRIVRVGGRSTPSDHLWSWGLPKAGQTQKLGIL